MIRFSGVQDGGVKIMTIAGTFWFIRAIAALLLLGCLLPEPVVAGGEWVDLGTLGGEYSYCTGLSGDGALLSDCRKAAQTLRGMDFYGQSRKGWSIWAPCPADHNLMPRRFRRMVWWLRDIRYHPNGIKCRFVGPVREEWWISAHLWGVDIFHLSPFQRTGRL